ncbi:MAG: DUF3313 domain-containing protein [Syntrophaceae bacterium]
MNKTLRLFFVVFLVLALAACATSKKQEQAAAPPPGGPAPGVQAPAVQPGQDQGYAPITQEGGAKNFLGQYYNVLQPGPKGGAEKRWLKPGVNFGKYNKVMLESVVFYLAGDSDYKGIDPQVMKDLSDKFNLTVANAIKDKYPIVTQPGPDVVILRPAITNLEQSRPVLSGVTSVVPIGLGISIIKRGAAGSWTGSGETGMAMMAVDSMTNDVVAAAEDRQHAGFTERFSKYGSAEDAFKFWADRLRKFMDETHGVKTS